MKMKSGVKTEELKKKAGFCSETGGRSEPEKWAALAAPQRQCYCGGAADLTAWCVAHMLMVSAEPHSGWLTRGSFKAILSDVSHHLRGHLCKIGQLASVRTGRTPGFRNGLKKKKSQSICSEQIQ